MIQAGITRSVPAEDPATSQAELARLRAEYEAELGVWRGKYQQAEVDRENSSSFEKVDYPTPTAFPLLSPDNNNECSLGSGCRRSWTA